MQTYFNLNLNIPAMDFDHFQKNYGNFDEQDMDDEHDDLKEQNVYKYHDNITNYDPKRQPFSYFYLTVSGQIEFGEFTDLNGLQCKYDFVAGDDWHLAGGSVSGIGQHAFKGVGEQVNRLNWNLEFELTYRSMTPFGWPQIVIYCTGRTTPEKEVVQAYGSIHVPISPGIHSKAVRMFSPIAPSSIFDFFNLYQTGGGEHIDQPEIIAKAEARDVSKVKAGGKIRVTFNVTQRNLDKHGYITTNELK